MYRMSSMKDIHEANKVHMYLVEFEGYDFMINEHIPLTLANAGYVIEKSKLMRLS